MGWPQHVACGSKITPHVYSRSDFFESPTQVSWHAFAMTLCLLQPSCTDIKGLLNGINSGAQGSEIAWSIVRTPASAFLIIL